MKAYLVAIAALATALAVFLGLVQPPPFLKQASDTAASANASDLKKEMSLLVGDPGNARW